MPAQKRIKTNEARKPRGRRRSRGRGRGRGRARGQRGGGVKNLLNKAINKLPVELHWPGHNFTGPGTKLERRLDGKDKPLPHSKPINRVDETSMYHDLCYRDNSSREGRTKCDRDMLKRLKKINKPSIRERVERTIIGGIIGAKARMGV